MRAGCCYQQKKVFREAVWCHCIYWSCCPPHVTGQNNLNRSRGTRLSLDTGVHVEGKIKHASCALIEQNCPALPPDSMPPSDKGHPGYAAQYSQGPPRTVVLCHTSTEGADSLSKSQPTHHKRPVPPQQGQANLSLDSVTPLCEERVLWASKGWFHTHWTRVRSNTARVAWRCVTVAKPLDTNRLNVHLN